MDMNLSKLQFEQRVGHNLVTEQQQGTQESLDTK